MPDYAKVSKERDVFGELGWIPNFNIKKSKNNEDRHNGYREFFDAPKDYTTEFHTASRSNTDGFRMQTAGDEVSQSAIRSVHSRGASIQESTHFSQTRRSLNAMERMSYSAARSTMSRT